MNAQLKSANTIVTIGQGTSKRFAQYTLIGATLVVLLTAVLATGQTFMHRSPAVITRTGLTYQEMKFLEQNTMFLDSASPDVAPPTVSSDRAKFLEVNTTLGMVADDVAPVARATYSQKFIEANTDLGLTIPTASPVITRSQYQFLEANMVTPAYPYGEAVTPVHGPR